MRIGRPEKISEPQIFSPPETSLPAGLPSTPQTISPCVAAAKKFSERYRPQKLSDVIGQPAAVRLLAALVKEPHSTCRLLVGPAGVGKSSAALAVAGELGCHDPFTDLHQITASDLSIDAARDLWAGPLRFAARSRSGYKILLVEELEQLHPQVQIFLKVGLEQLPPRTIVLATSNSVAKLDEALLQRFGQPLKFSGGALFAAAAILRLSEIWAAEAGEVSPPSELARWGWSGENFSMRVALDCIADHLTLSKAAA